MPHIILAEDDTLLRSLLIIGLRLIHPHAQISAARNGQEALMMYDLHGADLLITNVYMPLMNGFELLAAVRLRQPSLPTLIISGRLPLKQSVALDQQTQILLKPFSTTAFLTLVGHLLNGA